ncbi:MAG: hypothetical protein IT260_13950 [Saprospiraceae bacterium]|nr:hypothetical protein [Saprospiraceae bacterium]
MAESSKPPAAIPPGHSALLDSTQQPGKKVLLFILIAMVSYSAFNFLILDHLKTRTGDLPVVRCQDPKVYFQVKSNNGQQLDTLVLGPQFKSVGAIPQQRLYLSEHPKFVYWYFSNSLLTALSLALFLPVLFSILSWRRRLQASSQRSFWWVVACWGLFALAFLLAERLGTQQHKYPLFISDLMQTFSLIFGDSSQWLLPLMTVPVETTGLLAILGIGTLVLIANDWNWSGDSAEHLKASASALLSIREQFRWYVYIISGFILWGSLNTGMLRDFFDHLLGKDLSYLFPIDFIWAYGLKFSCILALVYLPVFYYLEEIEKRLLQRINSNPGAKAALSDETSILAKDNQFWKNLKIILATLAPLIGPLGKALLDFIMELG